MQQRASIQEALRDSALTLLTHALQSSPTEKMPGLETAGKESRLAKARSLVRLAEDFSNNRSNISIRMVDLCQVTEVSERTLQYAFKMCLGISPMNYLKRHRLHQVRHELKEADPAKSTVSAVASQFGFFHFGDFSKAYKAQFGESPSETLKRA
jgi:transcriptional regulator GlxA family with amidase domain